jgi:hypothetical protein
MSIHLKLKIIRRGTPWRVQIIQSVLMKAVSLLPGNRQSVNFLKKQIVGSEGSARAGEALKLGSWVFA